MASVLYEDKMMKGAGGTMDYEDLFSHRHKPLTFEVVYATTEHTESVSLHIGCRGSCSPSNYNLSLLHHPLASQTLSNIS